MDQGLDGLTKKRNRLLQLLSEQRAQLPPKVVWAGLDLAASVNAWALELHHESMSHVHRHKDELRRETEPLPTESAPSLTAAEWR